MRPITDERLINAFHDRLGGAIRDALADPDVIEVIFNASGHPPRKVSTALMLAIL